MEPSEILRTAIQPIIRDADDPLDLLTVDCVPARQILDQAVEPEPSYPSLGGTAPVVDIRGDDSAALLMRGSLVDPELMTHSMAVSLAEVFRRTCVRRDQDRSGLLMRDKVVHEAPHSIISPTFIRTIE
nr:hypothetical protein OG999_19995 [Streptomyces sp. NBC_00886]